MENKSKVVLVVDDELMNRFILNKILSSDRVIIHEAENGEEAFNVLSKHHVDIVLLDINMPIMDGYMFLDKISKDEKYFHLAILVVSATTKDIFYKKLEEKSINAPQLRGFIAKPIDINEIKEFVNNSC
jgi:hypothetical protein